MRITLDLGLRAVELDVADDRAVAVEPAPVALPDPAAAVRDALETPRDFPALRRALTPADHITVLVDEQLPQLPGLLTAILDHVASAGVSAEAITLLCPSSPWEAERIPPHPWRKELPERFRHTRLEVHNPADRGKLAYLATSAGGRRLYLNRTLVDADQAIVLTGRRYDLMLGHGGGAGAIYPALADQKTQEEAMRRANLDVPGAAPWPLRREAEEVAWLLGQPFFVQAVAGPGDDLAHVLAGPLPSLAEGQRLLDAAWLRVVPRRADLVVATVSGDPSRPTFADLAHALATAARVVRPDGRIVLLTEAHPALGAEMDALRQHDEPAEALAALHKHPTVENGPALEWTLAACQARLAVLCGLEDWLVEELFATPLADPAQLQRLVDAAASCLVLPDAHRMMTVLSS